MIFFAGLIVYTLLFILTISWTFGIFYYLKTKRRVTKATMLQTFSFWFILLIFTFTGWTKIHLVWLVPIVFIVETILSPCLFSHIPLKLCILNGPKELIRTWKILLFLKTRGKRKKRIMNLSKRNKAGIKMFITALVVSFFKSGLGTWAGWDVVIGEAVLIYLLLGVGTYLGKDIFG